MTVDDHEVKYVEETFDRYELIMKHVNNTKIINADKTAFYGGLCGNNLHTFNWACHAMMKEMKNADIVFSKYWQHRKGLHKEAYKGYFDWIVSRESPWFPMLEQSLSTRFNREFWFDSGFVFDGLDKVPSNYLQSFLIATRVPRQWGGYLKMWWWLLEEGIEPDMAFILCSAFQEPSGTKDQICIQFWPQDRGDWAIGMNMWTDESSKRFHTAKPNENHFNSPYKKSSSYSSPNTVNSIWYNDGWKKTENFFTYPERIGNKLKSLYQSSIGKIDNTGFGNYDTWKVSVKQLAEIGHAEQKRLGW